MRDARAADAEHVSSPVLFAHSCQLGVLREENARLKKRIDTLERCLNEKRFAADDSELTTRASKAREAVPIAVAARPAVDPAEVS